MDNGHLSSLGAPKAPHKTLRGAFKEAMRMSDEKGQPFMAYKCPVCPAYHIGREAIRGIPYEQVKVPRR